MTIEEKVKDGQSLSPQKEIELLRCGDSHLFEKYAANYPMCKYCDFIDAGLRMDAVEDTLNHRDANHGARQSLFKK